MRKVIKEIKNCLNCNKKFYSYKSEKQKFCSYKCAMNFRKNKKRPPFTKEWRKKLGDVQRGKKKPPFTSEHRKHISESQKKHSSFIGKFGILHPNWKGGRSPYPNYWTETLKRSIRERDNYICQICSQYGNQVHHIDYDKKNCNPGNLITLCRQCHQKTNFNIKEWKLFFERIPKKY